MITERVGINVQGELDVGDETGVVVDEGEEVASAELAAVNHAGTVKAVGLPQFVGEFGFEASAVPREVLNACRVR